MLTREQAIKLGQLAIALQEGCTFHAVEDGLLRVESAFPDNDPCYLKWNKLVNMWDYRDKLKDCV